METNYFNHFGIPISFLPDEAELRKKYLAFSKAHHPDFSAGNDAEYEQALLKTSLNNQAYKTLSDSFERIRYTLEMLGETVSQEDKLPPEFLMEMMDWNERIMDVGMGEEEGQLANLAKDFETLETTFDASLNESLQAYESTKDKTLLQQIKKSYLQRKYLLRLRDSINKFARL